MRCSASSPSSRPGPRKRGPGPSTKGAKAPQAAGEIHTDFERGFIRAETIAYDDYIASTARPAPATPARCAQEGKEYVVKDGDVLLFHFNV